MILSVAERLFIKDIIPHIQDWNFAYMKEARELVECLFTEQEESDLELEQDGGKVNWKTAQEDGTPIPQDREIEISEGLTKKIGKFLKQLDHEGRLKWGHYSLYEKFNSPEEL